MPIKVLPRPTKPPIDPPTPTKPAPGPAKPKLGAPTGRYPAGRIAGAGEWSKINTLDPTFVAEGEKHGVDPAMLKSMKIVESGDSLSTGTAGAGGATGIMQIKPQYWRDRAIAAGYDLGTNAGQIGMAAAILGGSVPGVKGANPRERFLYTYYPVVDDAGKLCLDCKGESGHTPRMYLEDIDLYTGIINAAAGKDTPKPKPAPTAAEILRLITGRTDAYVSFDFNELNTLSTSPIYKHGAGHGLPAGGRYHSGIDIWTPDETPIRAIFGGEVICVGTQGRVLWDQSCGYFVDDQHGVGNITILTDRYATIGGKRHRLKMTYGHMSSATVKVGDRIKDLHLIGRSGVGLKWPHVHLEVVLEAPELNNPQIWFNGGAYHLVDPLPTIISAWAGDDVEVEAPPELMPFTYLESPNRMSRQGRQPIWLVYHVSDDMSLDNVLGWLRQRGSNASSHWVVARDGRAYQLVGSAEAAFTNGAILNPRRDIASIDRLANDLNAGRANANWYSITIEHIGKPGQPFTPEQIATSTQISRYYLHRYPTIPRHRGGMIRHSDLASVKNKPNKPDPDGRTDRSYCPSDSFPLREIILATGGDPDRLAA
jgi:hypothetical protein